MRLFTYLLLTCSLMGSATAQGVCFGTPPANSFLAMGEDDWSVQSVSGGFPFDGTVYNEITINSNGYVMLGNVPGSDFSDSEAELLAQGPRIAMCWDDWSPQNAATGGGVFFDDDGVRACIVFMGVPAFGSTTRFCNMELVLWASGRIDFFYDLSMTVPNTSCIVGISEGGGASPNALDLSTFPSLPGSTGYELFVANSFDLRGRTIAFTPLAAGGYSLSDPTVCQPPPGPQGSLTTLFTSNGGGLVGGGNYFNLITGANDITIAAFEINSGDVGVTGLLNVYLIPGGSYVGNMASGVNAWGGVPVASGSVFIQGIDTPSFCALDQSFTLQANTTYAVALQAVGFGFRYTNGDGVAGVPGSGTNQTYLAGTDLRFEGGAANHIAFSSLPFDPRICNCRIHFERGAGCVLAARSEPYGDGCYNRQVSYYEQFPAGTNDLSGLPGTSTRTVQFVPNGVGGYLVVEGPDSWMGNNGFGVNAEGVASGTQPVSPSILNGDDVVVPVDLGSAGFTGLVDVPSTGGGSVLTLFVDSNGSISNDPGLMTDFSPSVAELLGEELRWAPLWTDLSPNIQGDVHFDVVGTSAYITWWDVLDFGASAGSNGNTFQVAFHPGGVVEYRYDRVTSGGGAIVGFSVGDGAEDPGASDIYDAALGAVTAIDLGAFSRPPLLRSLERPVSGTLFRLVTEDIDPAAQLGVLIISFIQRVPGIDLAFIAAPGCRAHIDPFSNATMDLFVPFGPSALSSLQLPLGFSGLELFYQTVMVGPSANPLGIMVSNGLRTRVGAL